jgi:hypothetical protein
LRRALIVSFALLFVCSPANADTASCARTLEDARQLHARGELHEALRAMRSCTDCDAIADVCAATRAQLESSIPTVSVTVSDPAGRPIPEAVVLVDGGPRAQGAPLGLDPGSHLIRAELGDHSAQQRVVLSERETHHVWLTLIRPAPPRMPASVIAIGGGSALALATAAGLWAWSQTISPPPLFAPAAQAPHPADAAAWDQTRTDLLIGADVALSCAIVGTLVAIVLYATAR